MQFSIIIPVYNESHRLPNNLVAAVEYLRSRFDKSEIIIVEDGSTQPVEQYVKSLSSVTGVELRYFYHHPNRGKGFSVKEGMMVARGELIAFIDADGSTPMVEMDRLINIISEGADIAIGSRAKPSKEKIVEKTIHRFLMGTFFTFLVKYLTGVDVYDSQCGFKIFRREAAKILFGELVTEGYAFDVEILARANKKGYTVVEVPIHWYDIAGSKLSLVGDSLRMLIDVIRISLFVK